MSINITAITAFNDNYIWAITNEKNNALVLVDPGDATPCLAFIKDNKLALTDILITHHHRDHVGGIEQLLTQTNHAINVYGPVNEHIPCQSSPLKEGDTVELLSVGLQLQVLDVPGHTNGHIAYVGNKQLFCGDTLFSGGCGRLFEGSPEQMLHSLTKFTHLAPDTHVYCAHEYTLANLYFALAVEPNNPDLLNYFNQVKSARNNGQATIPTTIGLEQKINPFLRTSITEVIESAETYQGKEMADEVQTFAAIRQWKDNF